MNLYCLLKFSQSCDSNYPYSDSNCIESCKWCFSVLAKVECDNCKMPRRFIDAILATETILSLQTNTTCIEDNNTAVDVGTIPADTLCHVGASPAKH